MPTSVVGDLDGVIGLLVEASAGVHLVCDADGTLVGQGVSDEVFRTAIETARTRLLAVPGVAAVTVATNGPPRRARDIVGRVGKPWTGRRRLGVSQRAAIWVVGDQVLSDGVWAWRLGAVRFVQLSISVGDEPDDQARLRRQGERLRRLFLRPVA